MKITVVGAGSWGTALGKIWAEAGHRVTLLARRSAVAENINVRRENPDYLPGIKLPPGLRATTDPGKALKGADLVVWAVPCQRLREVVSTLRNHLPPGGPFLSVIKGLEVAGLRTPLEVLREVLERGLFMVLSGPSFALEVARGLPTAVVLAGEDEGTVSRWQEALATERFRIYRSRDVRGVELCGALKNVVAIAAGISDGLGLGLNARAALITRGLAEIMRLGIRLGADPLTFSGLSGLGDLVLTCTGNLSRNYTVGYRLARGESLQTVLHSLGQVAEGVETVKAVRKLAHELSIEMPITEAVYRILYAGEPPEVALKGLLERPLKPEFAPLRP
ncbi:NAD(P)H-dependent glycerol-3-phosphate dehydrogenase [Thermosulfurimonas sp. F29]|uniref:NAD(P)H-dependent glycerol-3-phosphate dehydrogenase n=1 Tax=Thermosulfurimonas sp. F29 TaxID=2867247 RepID=UPI001C83E2C0|nr:NAD(P)H-dependent glycerol-3-phosphate dehydrogenase [Thermosulfurimonas sp. F29]MBX6422138.1 NAD(P)-dependent glycerol-3-phosphate dehydrogenase [Thermosulfurimonas sp. F29]